MDIEELLAPVSEESPSGENLEYDLELGVLDLQQLATPSPEKESAGVVTPAEDPDWREVEARALQTHERTRDLRVALVLLSSWLARRGLDGYVDGLRLVHGLLDRYWDSLYPVVDDGDAFERVSALMAIGDTTTNLRWLRASQLFGSRQLGMVTLYDIQVARGDLQPKSDSEPRDMAFLRAVMMEVGPEVVNEALGKVRQAAGLLSGIGSTLSAHGEVVDLDAPVRVLYGASQALGAFIESTRSGDSATGEGDGVDDEGAGGDQAAGRGASQGAGVRGPLRNRSDALNAIEAVCQYFRQHEPSSPVPMLLQRAAALVGKDFMTIVQNMAPDGVAQVENLRGPSDGET